MSRRSRLFARLAPLAELARASSASGARTGKVGDTEHTHTQAHTPLQPGELRVTAAHLRTIANGFDKFAEQLADVEARGQDAYAWQMRAAIAAFCPSIVALFEELQARCTPVSAAASDSADSNTQHEV